VVKGREFRLHNFSAQGIATDNWISCSYEFCCCSWRKLLHVIGDHARCSSRSGVAGAQSLTAAHITKLVHRFAMGVCGFLAHPAPQLPSSSVRNLLFSSCILSMQILSSAPIAKEIVNRFCFRPDQTRSCSCVFLTMRATGGVTQVGVGERSYGQVERQQEELVL
jgi:hypothetical protein